MVTSLFAFIYFILTFDIPNLNYADMKKLLAILIVSLSLTSCMTMMYGSWAAGAEYVNQVTDYSDQMYVLKEYFPEIYDLYRNGRITNPRVYSYKPKNGTPRYHITYSMR